MNAAAESIKSVFKIGAVGGIVALALFPKLDEMAALVGMPAEALLPHLVLADPARRPVGRARLPGDRRRRLPLPEAPVREEPQDGEGGGQAGAQAAGAPVRGQGRPAPPRDGARPRPHDGRGPDRRRRRDQPDPLLGRPQVRRRQPRSGGRRQGHRPPGPAHSHRGRRARRRRDSRPAAGACPVRERRRRPHDPRGALPGRRPAARLRLQGRRLRGPLSHEPPEEGQRATPTCSPPAPSCWSWR